MKRIILCVILCVFALSMKAQKQEDVIARRGSYQIEETKTSYRQTGPMLRLSAGTNIYGAIAYDYQVSSSFMIGGGIGVTETWEKDVNYYDYGGIYDCEAFLPIYIETEIRTPKYKWSLFLNLKVGGIISIGYENVDYFFASMMAGFSYKNISIGGGLSTMGNYNFGNLVLSISYDIPFSTLGKLFNP